MPDDRLEHVPNIARLYVIRSQIARVIGDLNTASVEHDECACAFASIERAMQQLARKVTVPRG